MIKNPPRIVATALVLTMSVVATGFTIRVAAAGNVPKAGKAVRKADTLLVGKMLVVGAATINGKKALSGSTIFSENRIAVASATGNAALINLGKLGRLDLAPGTELVLRFDDGLIAGELLAGEAVIRNNAGVKVAVKTPLGLAEADGREAATTVTSTNPNSAKLKTKASEAGTSTSAPNFNFPWTATVVSSSLAGGMMTWSFIDTADEVTPLRALGPFISDR